VGEDDPVCCALKRIDASEATGRSEIGIKQLTQYFQQAMKKKFTEYNPTFTADFIDPVTEYDLSGTTINVYA